MSELKPCYIDYDQYDAEKGERIRDLGKCAAKLFNISFLLSSVHEGRDATLHAAKIKRTYDIGADFYWVEYTVYNPSGHADTETTGLYRYGQWERNAGPEATDITVGGIRVIDAYFTQYEEEDFLDDLDLSGKKQIPIIHENIQPREIVWTG